MPIVPETKSWTWVLERPCPDCGFDSAAVDRDQLGAALRGVASAFADVLRTGEPTWLVTRPDDATWSPTEYACHVRDVFAVFHGRVLRMLAEEAPRFADWDQDATAVEADYASASPASVALELAVGVAPLATTYDGVRGAQWDRTGLRSDGARFTAETLGRYLLHDPVHHLWDVRLQRS